MCDLIYSMRNFEGEAGLQKQLIGSVQKSFQKKKKDYLHTIETLSPEDKNIGTQWLQGIVDHVVDRINRQLSGE